MVRRSEHDAWHHSSYQDGSEIGTNLLFGDTGLPAYPLDFSLPGLAEHQPVTTETKHGGGGGGIRASTTGTTATGGTTTLSATNPALTGSSSTVPGSHGTEALYLTEPGDTAAVSMNDIHQGQIGDCFLLAVVGELALTHPTAISAMIHQNAGGTESVRLYGAAGGGMPTYSTSSFTPLLTTVTNTFPGNSVDSGGQDVVNGVDEIWPQVIEKAYANLNGGYTTINDGGNPLIPMEELTGQAATWMSASALTLSELQGFMAAGDLIAMDTPNQSGLPFNLVGGHSYMFEGLTTANGAAAVQLANPWGFDQPAAIPLSQLSQGIIEVDIGRVA